MVLACGLKNKGYASLNSLTFHSFTFEVLVDHVWQSELFHKEAILARWVVLCSIKAVSIAL